MGPLYAPETHFSSLNGHLASKRLTLAILSLRFMASFFHNENKIPLQKVVHQKVKNWMVQTQFLWRSLLDQSTFHNHRLVSLRFMASFFHKKTKSRSKKLYTKR